MISLLHVDDEPSLLDITRLFLEREDDIVVTTSDSAEKALKIIKERSFDAIVSDYEMPEMNGIEFLKCVRSQDRMIPFILFTGKGREDVVIEAINNGADFYLQKGGKPKSQFAELKNMIKQAVQRRRAENELKASEQRYRAVVESQTELISRFRPDGIHVFANEAFCRYYGIAYEDLIGHKFLPHVPKEEKRIIHDHFASLTPEKPVGGIEHRIIMPDGEIRWQRWNDRAVFDNQGNVTEYQSVGRDETEQKRMEVSLQEKVNYVQALMDTIPAPVFYRDTKGIYHDCNRAFEELVGLPKEEIIGKEIHDFFTKDLADHYRYKDDLIIASPHVQQYEYQINDVNGEVKDVLFSKTARLRADGSVDGIVGVIVDISDRKKMEISLKEKVNYVQALMDTIPAPVFYRDTKGIYHDCNRAFEELVGLLKDEIIGKEIHDFFPREYSDIYKEKDDLIINKPYLQRYEFAITDAKGVVKDVLFSKTARLRADGTVDGIVGVILDISDRKRMEVSLKEEINFVQALKDTIPAPVFYRDREGIYRDCNRAFEELVSLSKDEIIGKTIHDFFFKEYADHYSEMDQRIIENPHVQRYEYQINDSRGRVYDVLFSKTALLKADGSVAGIVGVILDISDRKSMEEQVRESEEKFRTLANFTYDWEAWLDPDGKYFYISPSCERITGYSAEEFINEPLLVVNITHPEDREMIARHYENTLEETSSIYHIDYRIITRDGKIRWMSHYCQPVYHSDGTWAGRRETKRDITDRKLAEKAVQQANRKLNLLSNVTRHDVLNQVTAILGYLELAKEFSDSGELIELINRMESSIENIRSQISFTRDYQDVGIRSPTWQEINSTITRAIEMINMGTTGVFIDMDMGRVYADPLLDKVFFTMLDNTLRHGGEVTRVSFSTEESPEGIRIIYRDDGSGIPEAEKEKIFQRGYGRNTGYGLFLTQEILSITGLSISETGEEGKGAQFEIFIPPDLYKKYEFSGENDSSE